MSRRLTFALFSAALVTAGPAAAWQPAIVGLDDTGEPAASTPSAATDEVTVAPLQPHVVGIDDAGEYAKSVPSVALEGVAIATPWEPEVVGLYDDDAVRPGESLVQADSDAPDTAKVAAIAK